MERQQYAWEASGYVLSVLGWKLNPVVGAVYGPEFYAGNGWGQEQVGREEEGQVGL